jgi:hypothetical protein
LRPAVRASTHRFRAHLFNAHTDVVPFTLPGEPFATSWAVALDTADDRPAKEKAVRSHAAGAQLERPGLSLLVLRRVP